MTPAADPVETRFVLPADVVVVPVASLSGAVRARIDGSDEDFAVTRSTSRRPSSIVDPATAGLLAEFSEPSRLVDAVVRFSRARGVDPERTLEGAFEALQNFCNSRLLVAEDAEERHGARASLAPGQRLGGLEIVRLMRLLEDTELYQARKEAGEWVAVKLQADAEALAREAAVLRRLGDRTTPSRVAPRLVGEGEHDGRRWLAIEWRSGGSVVATADELRAGGEEGRRELTALCRRLLDAYVALHDAGVVHGDVHPGNALVDADGAVVLLDFGAARILDPESPFSRHVRAAVGQFYDPETAAAQRRGEMPPPATPASDQYALAVLVDRLLTGRYYLDLSAEADELLRQVAEEAPLPFSRRGAAPRPAVEAVLRRALAKEAGDRFPSVAAFRDALIEALEEETAGRDAPAVAVSRRRRLAELLPRIDYGSAWLDSGPSEAPRASLWGGGAGVAWLLYRRASLAGDAEALALADAWICRTEALFADGDGAFSAPERGLAPERVGAGNPFHTASGVHAVAARIASARGDDGAWAEEVGKFLAAVPRSGAAGSGGAGEAGEIAATAAPGPLELTFGRSGVLLAAATLLEAARESGSGPAAAEPLAARVDEISGELWRWAEGVDDVTRCPALPHLGLAHGWAGLLYAVLRARRALGRPAPAGLERPLGQLAALARPAGRGLAWPGTAPDLAHLGATPDHAPGWCSGGAGHVHLWLAAHEALGEPRHLELAERAAWAAWESPDRSATLCCGLAGRALALLRLYRHTGERRWRDRAERLASLAEPERADPGAGPLGLFKGALGPVLLEVELEAPEQAAMPLFSA